MDPQGTSSLFKDFIIPLLASGLGAFFGAFFAFSFERSGKKNDQLIAELNQARSLILVLTKQLNVLVLIKTKELDPERGHKDRDLILMPSDPGLNENFTILPTDVSFLLSKEKMEFAFNALIENDRFHAAISAIMARNEFHRKEFQPAIASIAVENNMLTREQAYAKLGPLITGAAKTYTDQVYLHVDETVVSHKHCIEECLKHFHEIFPGYKFEYASFNDDQPQEC